MRPAPRKAARAATQIRNGNRAMTSERATWLAMARPLLRAKLDPPSAMAARIERARAGKEMRRIVGLDIVDRKIVRTRASSGADNGIHSSARCAKLRDPIS